MLNPSQERFLIVSLGSIGRRHLNNLRKLRPKAQIAALRLHSAVQSEGLPAGVDQQFDSIENAIAFSPHAAIIASPATTHVKIAKALLAANVPMLIEKPLADDTEELHQFVHDVSKSKLPVVLGYHMRLLPALAKARTMIEQNVIGSVVGVRAEVGQYLPDWRPGTPYQNSVSAQQVLGGGVLLELSHELDYIYWMFGLPDAVTAQGGCTGNLEIDVEDMVELCFEYGQPKRLINIHLDFLQRAPYRSCRFIGTEGTLIWSGLQNNLDVYRAATGQWEHFTFPVEDRNQVYLEELSQFLHCINGHPTVLATAKEGYDVIAIVEAAKRSIKLRRTVDMKGYAHG